MHPKLVTPLSGVAPVLPEQQEETFADTPPREEWSDPVVPWTLQRLTHKHVTMCTLYAQGLANKKIASLLEWAPEYITMLLRQPLIKDKIKEFAEAADARLLALTDQSVEVIAEVLREGNHKEKLNAARLQLEAVSRVGASKAGSVVLNQKFVVNLPPKEASSADWAAKNQRPALEGIAHAVQE